MNYLKILPVIAGILLVGGITLGVQTSYQFDPFDACPDDTIYNPALNRCEAPPICPEGVLFNPETDLCDALPPCPDNSIYNPTTNLCEKTPVPCPEDSTYNTESNKCEKDPCPNGNLVEGTCIANIIQSCPPSPFREPSIIGGKCVYKEVPNCLVPNFAWSDMCVIGKTSGEECPVGMVETTDYVCDIAPQVVNDQLIGDERPLCPPGFQIDRAAFGLSCIKEVCEAENYVWSIDQCVLGNDPGVNPWSCLGKGNYNLISKKCEVAPRSDGTCPSGIKVGLVCQNEPDCFDPRGTLQPNGFCTFDASCDYGEQEGNLCKKASFCPNDTPEHDAAIFLKNFCVEGKLAEQLGPVVPAVLVRSPVMCGAAAYTSNNACPEVRETSLNINAWKCIDDNNAIITEQCEANIINTCPGDLTIDGQICSGANKCTTAVPLVGEVCSASDLCPAGVPLNTTTDVCEAADLCPIDAPLNPDTDLCEADFTCPYRTHFDPATDQCITIIYNASIKPSSDPNPINIKSNGKVPVAILGSDSFDITTVDQTSITFGPGDAPPEHDLTVPGIHEGHQQDVNSDSFKDLVSHYSQKLTGVVTSDNFACINGQLNDGSFFIACDNVIVK